MHGVQGQPLQNCMGPHFGFGQGQPWPILRPCRAPIKAHELKAIANRHSFQYVDNASQACHCRQIRRSAARAGSMWCVGHHGLGLIARAILANSPKLPSGPKSYLHACFRDNLRHTGEQGLSLLHRSQARMQCNLYIAHSQTLHLVCRITVVTLRDCLLQASGSCCLPQSSHADGLHAPCQNPPWTWKGK